MSILKHIVIFVSLFLFLTDVANAQSKRYILLEHFTSTECTECPTKNDQFYNSILANNLIDVIHISYHAPFPTNRGFFYIQNPEDNDAAANYYGISSTKALLFLINLP